MKLLTPIIQQQVSRLLYAHFSSDGSKTEETFLRPFFFRRIKGTP